ncbi:acetyl/propionyl/methylcrotonyl-CoA carboxylase subunit alpha [Ramlibacter sp.]|uniref:acetyl/propionyl/methylcrotonyl-CoA carboxylase subunit alpha n=1 Tax=Ramlibacter sp. TaxID=1917967 RepID=UPI002CC331FA|nr:biotin carboxylase N-terminal domain-containing protein [Ramlibacter sp.]HWI84140.1 biotin carboxylase N-terminal domain-containing protein [Ramlibacter sp.]
MQRLLVANRGEIAVRIMRTARRLGLQTVAVYADPDRDAPHVREADQAIGLGGAAAAGSYLCIERIVGAARSSGADAVHPGYGFLSEDERFAQAVVDAGLRWVGPPPAAIRLLGNKRSARRLAQSLGVPTLPGYEGQEQSDERFAAEAERIGYPLMVKAAAGGGGRGMRLVRGPGELRAAVVGARSEAQAAFGSGELLLERALPAPRHVEVQVFADAHGHCIHLGERDCSVQRRHQKLLEEAPSPALTAALRERMGRCAVELARAAGYVGAGTVEFLLAEGEPAGLRPADAGGPAANEAAFFLMEVNTRLQVEHPVTEAITGLDLVAWQLRVAQGEPLPLTQDQVRLQGHAIEARLCAEDERFVPQTGVVRQFSAPEGVRFDHALAVGQRVSEHYDSLLGKLVVHAATRDAAIEALAAALDRMQLLGLPTNRRLLAACLRHPRFRAGAALVPFLEQHGEALRSQLLQEERALIADATLAALYGPTASGLPCPFPRPLRVLHRGERLELRVRELAGGQLEVQGDGERRTAPPPRAARVLLAAGRWHVQLGAVDLLLQDASFEPPAAAGDAAGHELRAPFNGRVIAVPALPGARVRRGETLLVLESMKLEHALAAPRDGIVGAVHVGAGQQAGTGQLLVSLAAHGGAEAMKDRAARQSGP